MAQTNKLDVLVFRGRQLCFTVELDDFLQIGRARPDEPVAPNFDRDRRRLIIAPLDEKLVSREHLRLQRHSASDPTAGTDDVRLVDSVTVTNLSRKRSVWVDGHGRLAPEATILQQPPIVLTFEDFSIHVSEQDTTGDWQFLSLDHATMAPGRAGAVQAEQASRVAEASILRESVASEHSSEQLIHWLSETMGVLQSAAATDDYLQQAVEAVDRIVGLDAIVALRLVGNKWQPHSSLEKRPGATEVMPSRQVLEQVVRQKRTVRRLPAQSVPTQSLQGVSALVAAPILNPAGEVIGILYGVRHHSSFELPQISELEATIVDVIAAGAAAGIAREKEQERAIAARIQFEQFFTPQLARELERNPEMLVGQDADISVLFCDIVGFSSISGRIGSSMTMRWVGDVMTQLSEAVIQHEGVLVDYIGDELMAMWGAPGAQLDHCHLAANAATALLDCRAAIDRQWAGTIGAKTDLRIGIASGNASVGNTGSKRKFKYGPLGETVNLASRLQGAAKQFGAHILVDEATFDGLPASSGLVCRPLGKVRLVNINQPAGVHEILYAPQASAKELARYFCTITEALDEDDRGKLANTIRLAVEQFPDDVPTRLLEQQLAQNAVLSKEALWSFGTK